MKPVFQTFHQYYAFLENKTKLNIPQLSHESFPRIQRSAQCIAQTFMQLLLLSQNLKGSEIIIDCLQACLMRGKH